MADDTARRREVAARAFAARRGELGLTQEQVASRGQVAVKTIQSFESRTRPRYPNARSRSRLERAVSWPAGEIDRIARGPAPNLPPELVEQARQLSPDVRQRLKDFLESLDEDDPHHSAAAG